jgi:hypothetical protein
MKVRCRSCGEFFSPSNEAVELISEGYISSDSEIFCDDCWDLLEHAQEDISEIHSGADIGL